MAILRGECWNEIGGIRIPSEGFMQLAFAWRNKDDPPPPASPAPTCTDAVTLRSLVEPCNSVQMTQTMWCISAAHRFCNNRNSSWSGAVQEVGDGVVGVACFRSDFKNIAYADMIKKHGECTGVDVAASAACRAASFRQCVGLVVEAVQSELGVACYTGDYKYEGIKLTELQQLAGGCSSVHSSRSSDCVAAAHRACFKRGKAAGLIGEVGSDEFGVACIDAEWYGEVCL